jgi:hypothetical protein
MEQSVTKESAISDQRGLAPSLRSGQAVQADALSRKDRAQRRTAGLRDEKDSISYPKKITARCDDGAMVQVSFFILRRESK